MKTLKYLLRPAALSLLWLSVGLGCKKEVTPTQTYCDPGVCCLPNAANHIALDYVEGVRGYISGMPPQFATITLSIESRYPKGAECQDGTVSVCELSTDKVKDLKVSEDPINPQHMYRVWGTVYRLNVPTFTCIPILYISIDRIEPMK
jgi:hypothetical protein